jgi:hypothetical protein
MKLNQNDKTPCRLLPRIGYVSRNAKTITDINGVERTIRDTFAFNLESKTSPKTAQAWAEQGNWDYENSKWSTGGITTIELENTPFSTSIVDIDVRSEGGRAYKVVDDQDRCFDLREDQIIECISRHGIERGGYVTGEFVWGVLGSTLRLVLVGGKLHTRMVEATAKLAEAERNKTNAVAFTANTFKVGRLYKMANGEKRLFLGNVNVGDSLKRYSAFVRDRDDDGYRYNIERDEWLAMSHAQRYVAVHNADNGISTVESIILLTTTRFIEELDVDASDLVAMIKSDMTNINKSIMFINGYYECLGTKAREKRGEKTTIVASPRWYNYLSCREYEIVGKQRIELADEIRKEFSASVKWL